MLRRWCEALGQEHRGQRLAGLAREIFLKLLKAKREAPGAAERQKTLAAQDGKRALCGCGLTAGTCKLDHVVPVRQAFAGSVQTLQALCGERAAQQPGEPHGPRPHGARLEPQAAPSGFLRRRRVGVDVVRCRRNGLANAPFPLPILFPADGVLPDLGFVEGCCDARQSCLNLLPYVGPGWYPKVSLAAMLELGVCRWDHIVLGISARSHVDAATLRRALERMDAAWPESEEHMAKLSANAMIGLRRAQQQQRAGRRGRGFSQAFAWPRPGASWTRRRGTSRR